MLKINATKKTVQHIILASLILAIIIYSFYDFTHSVNNKLRAQTQTLLQENNQRIINTLEKRISDMFYTLNAISIFVREDPDLISDRTLKVLDKQTNINDFHSLSIITKDGKGYQSNGKMIDCSNSDFFIKSMTGRYCVASLECPATNSAEHIVFSVPIYKNDHIVSVLAGFCRTNIFSELLDIEIFNGKGYTYIIKQNGQIITQSMFQNDCSNYIDLLKNQEFERSYSLNKFVGDMAENKSGTMRYFKNSEPHIASYAPAGVNDWYVLTVVPARYVGSQTEDISHYALLLVLKEFVVLLGLLIYVVYMQRCNTRELTDTNQKFEALTANIPGGVFRYAANEDWAFDFISEGLLQLFGCTEKRFRERFDNRVMNMVYEPDRNRVLQDINTQFARKDSYKLEFRIVSEDGKIHWLFDRGQLVKDTGGRYWVYVVVMDITATKLATEKLRLSEERYRIVSEQSHSVIFEYNLDTDEIFYTKNFEKKFGYPPVTHHFPQSNIQNNIVYYDDQLQYKKFFASIISGEKNYDEMECRILKSDGGYLWCQIQVSLIRGDEGHPLKIVGRITDIDKSKRENERLKEASQRDPLTKLYNKAATQTLISNFLQNEGCDGFHALLFIDVDNFKGVNDNLGHLFGDAVLSRISQNMLQLFHPADIIGRIGGDEFVVFLKNVGSREIIMEKANDLCKVFHEIYTGNDQNYRISGSVGIAIYPTDGRTYKELIKNADFALYLVKNSGKDRYAFYKSE